MCYGKKKMVGRSHYAISLPKTEAGIRYIPMTDEVYDVFKAEYYRQQENGFSQFSIEGMSDLYLQIVVEEFIINKL